MATSLTYPTLGTHLVDALPELKPRYDALFQAWQDETPGPHVIFGDVLNPLLLKLLEGDDATAINRSVLRRIFAFLEILAGHPDPRVQEVIAVTVCERLGDDPSVLARARPLMGRQTRDLSEKIEHFWADDKTPTWIGEAEGAIASRRGFVP